MGLGLDYDIAQITRRTGDPRQRANIDYWTAQPPDVRKMLELDPADRADYAKQLSEGWPDKEGSAQIDVEIMVNGSNPLAVMQQRQMDGLYWVPAANQPHPPASATTIETATQENMPPGAILVTVEFGEPAPDLRISVKPFQWRADRAPGPNPNGVGSTWWPLNDNSQELSVWIDPEDQSKYQKLSVIGYMGAAQLKWVRLS